MGVEQGQLLVPVYRVEGVVDVQDDRAGRPPVAGAELVHHRSHHSGDLDLRRRVFKPRHRRLRAQGITRLRAPPQRQLEQRIVAQCIAVVGILVARRNRKHPQPQHLLYRVQDSIRIALVPDAPRQPGRQTQPSFHATQQQHAPVRRQHPAVKPHAHLLARNRWKIEGEYSIFAHGGCGAPQSIDDSASQPES